MATGWVKSLQCKSRALEDVYLPSPKHLNNLALSSSCRKSAQSLKDVVETTKKTHKKPRKSNPTATTRQSSSKHHHHHSSSKPTKSSPSDPTHCSSTRSSSSSTTSTLTRAQASESFFPALTELPEGHPSRKVVEIIFHTSWYPKEFSGRIEMLFKIQNLQKTVARFEEYREIVKSRALTCSSNSNNTNEDDARCIADGNEVMRFHCLGATAGAIYDILCKFSGKDTAVCTFSGSGAAHESGGGGKGRRAMLLCRVIAGRVCKRFGVDSFVDSRVGFDSVGGENGELLVLDSRAVLPCFLIIYKL